MKILSYCPKPVWLCFFYFTWNIKEDILKIVGVQTVSVFCKKNTMEVYRNRSCLVTNILQNILYCVPKKKERFRRTWVWVNDRIFILGWTVHLRRTKQTRNLKKICEHFAQGPQYCSSQGPSIEQEAIIQALMDFPTSVLAQTLYDCILWETCILLCNVLHYK